MAAPVGRGGGRSGGARKPREERWAELLQVATEVFYEKGYDGASLQDIADRLGLLKGSLYYYIRSKEELLYDVIRDVHKAGLDNIVSRAAVEGDALERLRNVIVGHVEHICRNRVKTAVFLHEIEVLDEERRREVLGDQHSYQWVFRELVIEGQQQGLVRTDLDPKLTALGILGAANWVYRWYRPDGRHTPTEVGEHLATTSLGGIREPSDGRRHD